MQRQITLHLVEGDSAPDLPVRFLGLDLSDYSSIKMYIVLDTGRRITRTVTPDDEDPELGSVAWQGGDLIRGQHSAEFEFVQVSDAKKFTLPQKYTIILDVRKDLG